MRPASSTASSEQVGSRSWTRRRVSAPNMAHQKSRGIHIEAARGSFYYRPPVILAKRCAKYPPNGPLQYFGLFPSPLHNYAPPARARASLSSICLPEGEPRSSKC